MVIVEVWYGGHIVPESLITSVQIQSRVGILIEILFGRCTWVLVHRLW